jgi:diguanylate cyclase (GGDEF)-like protein
MLDIDYFKRYNDTYGHVVGDHCLAEVAKAVKNCCHRKADLAVRYGGEEFAVLLPDTDIHGAMTLAEQIRRSVIDMHIIHTGSPHGHVTVSLGCYSFIPTGRDPMDMFIERADAALYQAKHSGRNRSATLAMEGVGEALMRSDR